jgi:hypothetical protein
LATADTARRYADSYNWWREFHVKPRDVPLERCASWELLLEPLIKKYILRPATNFLGQGLFTAGHSNLKPVFMPPVGHNMKSSAMLLKFHMLFTRACRLLLYNPQ